MKKIVIGLIIGIFLIGSVIGMIRVVTGFFTGNFEVARGGAVIIIMSLLLIAALPMALDIIEEYLE